MNRITRVTFNSKLHGVIRKGKSYHIEPLTFIVGDNGIGKTTFLEALYSKISEKKGNVSIDNNGKEGLEGYVYYDAEKMNPRSQHGDEASLFGIASNWRSHGETEMDLMVNDISQKKNTLLILDEPDLGLSIRSASRLYDCLKSAVENNCQVLASIHSETIIRKAGRVLSLEHGRWVSADTFLKSQENPKLLRTVDNDERKCNYRIFVKLDEDRMKSDRVASNFMFCDYEGELGRYLNAWSIGREKFFSKEFRTECAAKKLLDKIHSRKELKLHPWNKNIYSYITDIHLEKRYDYFKE